MKILVVEDDQNYQNFMSLLLEIWGYEADIVANGQAAVKKAQINDGEYDLCLMDIDMPIMNGFEATKIIRKKTKYFPIMALTANSDIEDIYLEIGMDDFLMKPYDPNQLHNKITELMIKTEIVDIKNNNLCITKEIPMDQKHVQELRELAKKDLRKVKFFDSPGSIVIIHKNVTNKISHDFIVKKQLLTTFINRDPEKPTRCELYKESNHLMPQTYLTEEEYTDITLEEDKGLDNYPKPISKEQVEE